MIFKTVLAALVVVSIASCDPCPSFGAGCGSLLEVVFPGGVAVERAELTLDGSVFTVECDDPQSGAHGRTTLLCGQDSIVVTDLTPTTVEGRLFAGNLVASFVGSPEYVEIEDGCGRETQCVKGVARAILVAE